MAVLYPVRKACPQCCRPMKAGLRYVCTNCDDDPLHDPTALKWVDSPLKPPADPET